MVEAATLTNVPDLLRYVTFVYPDYTKLHASVFDNGDDTATTVNEASLVENDAKAERVSPWNSSKLCKTLLQWIFAFYSMCNPLAKKLKEAVDETMKDNFSLMKNVFQNERTIFKAKKDRLTILRQLMQLYCQHLAPEQVDFYRKIESSAVFANEHENTHQQHVYFALPDPQKETPGFFPMGREFVFKKAVWRYGFLPKCEKRLYDIIAIYAFQEEGHHRKSNPIKSPIQRSARKMRVAVAGYCTTLFGNYVLRNTGIIVPGEGQCRFDVLDEKSRFTSNSFEVNKQGAKFAVATIEMTFLGYVK